MSRSASLRVAPNATETTMHHPASRSRAHAASGRGATPELGSIHAWSALRHPLWWGALLVLLANDHWLKGAGIAPGWLTGKLSDVAGLLVAPALLAALAGVRRRATLLVCHAIPVVALAALKLFPEVATQVVAWAALVGESWAIVADPTDLLAAPAVLVAWRVLVPRMRPVRGERADAHGALLAAFGALACVATSRRPPQLPAIDGAEVLVQPWPSGALLRLDARSGQVRGRVEVGEHTYLSPPILREGAVWFAGEGGLRALDLGSGAELWRHPGRFDALADVDAHAVYAFAPCAGERCDEPRWHAIDRRTHASRWSAAGRFDVHPVLGDGLVALAEGPRLVVRDVTSAEPVWVRSFAGEARALAIDEGVVWALEQDPGSLYALDASSGREERRFPLEGAERVGRPEPHALPNVAAGGGLLYIAVGGQVRAYSAVSAAPRWERPGTGVARSGELVVLTTSEGLEGVDATTGTRRWEQPVRGAVVVQGEHIAIRLGDELLELRDRSTGQLRFRYDLERGEATRAGPDERQH